MRVDTTDMLDMIAGRLATGRAAAPLWFSLDEFAALFSQADDLPPGTVQRWANHIQQLDPLKDAVLFLLSTPDGDGRSFSRIVAVRGEGGAEEPVQR